MKLRQPQIRILAALARKSGPTRSELAERAEVDLDSLVEYVGSSDPNIRKANDKKHFPSLLSLGFIFIVSLANDPTVSARYGISDKGKAALAAAQRAAR